MKKEMTILYEVHNNLYVNLTNKCPCSCTFCLRNNRDTLLKEAEYSLWLDHDPSVQEIKAAFNEFDMTKYEELVFCGYGEPTERLDVLLEIAKFAKDNFGIKVRVNTNGLANLIWDRDTTAEFQGLVDTISISLNTPNPEKYNEIVRPKFGIKSHQAMLDFASRVKNYVPNVVFTTVETTLTKEEEEECARICSDLGVKYRIREWED